MGTRFGLLQHDLVGEPQTFAGRAGIACDERGSAKRIRGGRQCYSSFLSLYVSHSLW